MLIVRSLLFNVVFYANLILWLIILIPGFLMPRRVFMELVKMWARTSLWLLRVIAGIRAVRRSRRAAPWWRPSTSRSWKPSPW
jgi:1-acyl-sn-glycerol-3-phosphate acyltransferase